MVTKAHALARAEAWRQRAIGWTRTRDRAAHLGFEDSATTAQRSSDECRDRARQWQSLADGPVWQRLIRSLPSDYFM